MKGIIRLTESELKAIVNKSVQKLLKEDVLGDNWHENDVMNNYEPFETQMENDPFEGTYSNDHDWSGQGEEDIDPSYYDDPDWYRDDVMGINDNPSDGDLYRGGY